MLLCNIVIKYGCSSSQKQRSIAIWQALVYLDALVGSNYTLSFSWRYTRHEPRPPPLSGVSRSHTRKVSYEKVISSSQRPLTTRDKTNKRKEQPCPRRDSKPRSQQSGGLRLTPPDCWDRLSFHFANWKIRTQDRVVKTLLLTEQFVLYQFVLN
jgi:hypothetical protein